MKDIVNMTHANDTRITANMTITGDAATGIGIGIGHDISSQTTRYSMTAT